MTGMEINAGEPFNPENQTVTQLITWLQSQDQNAKVTLKDGGTLVFKRLRLGDGGGIQVEVVPEEGSRKPRPKSKAERALEQQGVSATSDPAKAAEIVSEAKGDTKSSDSKAKPVEDDVVLGKNEGKDQGGVVPGTSKVGSEKDTGNSGSRTK